VDARLGDDAETSEFLTQVLWLETAIRLARLGWGINKLEEARWPVARAGSRHCSAPVSEPFVKIPA
jgi:hypothetical protein